MPVALVLPLDDEDVISAVKAARKFKVSIVPRGGGTSLGGQAAGPSLIIDFTKFYESCTGAKREGKMGKGSAGHCTR